jgi:glycosyltransferase involved in cell wall biosynthesis
MTDHIVLIFAYHFPPENAIGGARPFRFAKYLSRLGYTCRVYTAAEQTGRDDSNTEYIPDPFVAHPGGLGWHVERAIRKVFLPRELGTRWSYLAFRAARAYIRAHPGVRVTIFSTFPPLGPHLAAYQLAHAEGIPWIADFRDPLPEERIGKGINFPRRAYKWLERAIARRADAVIANTDSATIRWREKFPNLNGKVQLIWNGFDPEERIQSLPVLSRDYKILSHVGELYGGRNATLVLESFARLIAAGRLPAGSVRVQLIGPADAGVLPNQDFLGRARAEGWLELVTKKVPRHEALNIARSSNSLLLLQPQSSTQVPGKLFEYLQIGRPILAVIQPNSPAERLLERSGVPYRCVYPGTTPAAIDNIVAGFFELPSTAVSPSPWFEEQFNAEHQTRTLDALIRSLQNGMTAVRESNPRESALSSRT